MVDDKYKDKIRKYKPQVVALVGVTLYRAIVPLVAPVANDRAKRSPRRASLEPVIGMQPFTIHGARVFVLPNPSGRNANFSYAEMLEAFRSLRRAVLSG